MSLASLVAPFLGPVGQATLAFPVAASLLALPFALYHYRRHGHVHPLRALVTYSFVYYLLAAVFLVIFPLPDLPARGGDPSVWEARYGRLRQPELNPLVFLRNIVAHRGRSGFARALSQALFNFALFLPFGFYLVYAFKRRLLAALPWAFAASLAFELIQFSGDLWIYPGPYRLFDTGDVLLNCLGAACGALVALLLIRLHVLPDLDGLEGPKKPWIGPFRRLLGFLIDAGALVLSALALAFGADRLARGGEAATRAIWAGLLLFWFVLLPAVDGGRGLGKRLTLCALTQARGRKARGRPAGFFLVLKRQALLWALPALAWALPAFFPASQALALSSLVLLLSWLTLWLINLFGICFSAEHAGWLDAWLGIRVRNRWKKPRKASKRRVPLH
jgi:glycopeptide antibiotics resistance protein